MDALFVFLHILVLVYWLGGDLGAFYASRLVVEAERPAAGRLAAASILMNVDMAPRMALIFAFPTGLALAAGKGWLIVAPVWTAAAFLIAALWAGLAWMVHLKAGPHALAATLDRAIRIAALVGLTGAGTAGLAGLMAMPVFLAIKFLLLALAIASGLMIRQALGPFGPAFAKLAAGQSGPDEDAIITASLAHAKRYVLLIWAALLTAAALGVTTPI